MERMDDLVQFLRDRLDEDEQTARAWHEDERVWQHVGDRNLRYANGSSQRVQAVDVSNASSMWDEQVFVKGAQEDKAEHIARHDPARVLREVEAKRELLADYERFVAERRRLMGGWDSYSEPSPVLTAFAAVYAEHPDYRDDWRP